MGHSLPQLLALESTAESTAESTSAQAQAKQVLVVYEEGGISQMDTWDPKPNAPADHCTPYKPIATNVPGGQVIGETNRDGGEVVESRYTPADYAETIYRKLGINTAARLRRPDGRPIDFTDSGRAIAGLF